MTAITYVSQKEMKQRTGFGRALGYSLPQEDEILLRKGLTKEKKKEVLAHEEDHIARGEEGPFLGALIGGAISLFGASKSASSSKRAAATAAAGSERDIEFQRESRDLARGDQAPYVAAGQTALSALMDMTGLSGMGGGGSPARLTGPRQDGGGQARSMFNGGPPPGRSMRRRGSSYGRVNKYSGGPIGPDTQYNINEMGPENVYTEGSYTRGKGPSTIDGQTGYVEPNTESRYRGGPMGDRGGRFRRTTEQSGGNPPALPNFNQGGNTANSTAVDPSTGFPVENDGGREGGYQFQTDPGYQFRVEEGQRALDRGASARGGLLSGGMARKAIRYGQDYASAEYSNVYNRISNIAGLGQTANQASGNAALMAGQGMGNAASSGANASAYGQVQSGNAWANAGNQIAQLPWDQIGNNSPKPQLDFQGRPIQYN